MCLSVIIERMIESKYLIGRIVHFRSENAIFTLKRDSGTSIEQADRPDHRDLRDVCALRGKDEPPAVTEVELEIFSPLFFKGKMKFGRST